MTSDENVANRKTKIRFLNGIYDIEDHSFTPSLLPLNNNIRYVDHSASAMKYELELLLHNIFPDLHDYYNFMHSCCHILRYDSIARIHYWCGNSSSKSIISKLMSFAFGSYFMRIPIRVLTGTRSHNDAYIANLTSTERKI